MVGSVFFITGDGVGEIVGDAVGETPGVGVEVGLGVAAVLIGVSGFGSQAPRSATLAAKTVDNIKVILIVFSSIELNTRTGAVRQP